LWPGSNSWNGLGAIIFVTPSLLDCENDKDPRNVIKEHAGEG
jgi:hypothetical protein